MRPLFTLVKASLLALLPFLIATLKTAALGPDFIVTLHTPPLTDLREPLNAALTAFFGYEAAARVLPTDKDISAISAILRGLNEFLANRSTGFQSGRPLYHDR